MRLASKVAIIIGAGSGIGRAAAMLFAREGAKVVVADINDAGGEETVAAVRSKGSEAVFIHADVSVAVEVENLIRQTKEKFGGIDILLNSAGIMQRLASVEELDELSWDRVYAVNVKSIFLTVKFAAPVMKERGGSIINVASIAGVRPRPCRCAYSSSKAAVIHLTKAMALDLAASNTRVNVINPTAVDTPMLAGVYAKEPTEAKKALLSTIPLGRVATPEDVANAALYLASEESAMLTGSSINVDGGRGI